MCRHKRNLLGYFFGGVAMLGALMEFNDSHKTVRTKGEKTKWSHIEAKEQKKFRPGLV